MYAEKKNILGDTASFRKWSQELSAEPKDNHKRTSEGAGGIRHQICRCRSTIERIFHHHSLKGFYITKKLVQQDHLKQTRLEGDHQPFGTAFSGQIKQKCNY